MTRSLVILLVLCSGLSADRVINMSIDLYQPDGTKISCFVSGDEFYRRVFDVENYTIIRDSISGYYVYAKEENGFLISTSAIVGKLDPSALGIIPGLHDTQKLGSVLESDMFSSITNLENYRTPNTGLVNNISIFIRFNDQNEYSDESSFYSGKFNTNPISLKNYFLEASYDLLTIETHIFPAPQSGIITSYLDPHNRNYYSPYHSIDNPNGYTNYDERTEREHLLLANAIGYISSDVSTDMDLDGDGDGFIDNICFIVKGPRDVWNDLLWPHRWYLFSQDVFVNGVQALDYNFLLSEDLECEDCGVGVLSHEMFHSIGAPDLYHYSQDDFTPVGSWDLMEWNTDPPQHMGAYMKYRYGGWIPSIPTITDSYGTYSLNDLTEEENNCFKIDSPYSANEYFVVENRNQIQEPTLPGSGLIVYRINSIEEGAGNSEGPPDEVYIYRPDGTLANDGEINDANFSTDVGRTVINDITNPSPFLSNGNIGGLNINNIGNSGNTITFNYLGNPSISGYVLTIENIGIGGVTITFTSENESVVTDQNGHYTKNLPFGWSGYINLQKEDYQFENNNMYLNYVNAAMTQDFIGAFIYPNWIYYNYQNDGFHIIHKIKPDGSQWENIEQDADLLDVSDNDEYMLYKSILYPPYGNYELVRTSLIANESEILPYMANMNNTNWGVFVNDYNTVYASISSNSGADLYKYNFENQSWTNIAANPFNVRPYFSPDRSSFIYYEQASNDQYSRLILVDSNTDDTIELAYNAKVLFGSTAWSISNYVYYEGLVAAGSEYSQIWRVNLLTHEIEQCFQQLGPSFGPIALKNDPSKILFSILDTTDLENGNFNTSLHLYDEITDEITSLHTWTNNHYIEIISTAPDENRCAIFLNRDGGEDDDVGLYVYDIDNNNYSFLFDGRNPVWSGISTTTGQISIDGYVQVEDGAGIEDVTVEFGNGGGITFTNSAGYYLHTVANGWSGTVTPFKENYTFTPQNINYENLNSSLTDQNFIGAPLIIYNEWELSYQMPAGEILNDVKAVDSYNVIVVGNNDEIYTTINGGNLWEESPTGNSCDFIGVDAIGDNVWVISDDGSILHSDNFGESWINQTNPGISDLSKVGFFNVNEGVITTSGGLILITNDGGDSWIEYDTDTNASLNNIDIYNNVGLIVGDDGTILRTENYGSTWNNISYGTSYDLIDVKVVNEESAYILLESGSVQVLKTIDGGLSWQEYSIATNRTWKAIDFIDSMNGVVIRSDGLRYITEDGGVTWNTMYIFPGLKNIYYLNNGFGWYVGYYQFNDVTLGQFIRYDPGNYSTISQKIARVPLNDIYFSDSDNGWAAGGNRYNIAGINRDVLLHTNDGGLNWVKALDVSGSGLYDLKFFNENIGYAANRNGIYKTIDGGDTWSYIPITDDYSLGRMSIADQNTIYTTGSRNYMYKSTDMGETWVGQYPSVGNTYYQSITFINSQQGWAAGYGLPSPFTSKIISTNDGGINWHIQYDELGGRTWIHMNSSLHGWAVSAEGRILFTPNGGMTWSEQVSTVEEDLFRVHFVNDNIGYAVGDNGTIVKTTDGGANWLEENVTIDYPIYSVSINQSGEVWAVGEYGIILKSVIDPNTLNSNEEHIFPNEYSLNQNYPNPFNPTTTIKYGLPEKSDITLTVFNIRGQKVTRLVKETQEAGWYEYSWSGLDDSGRPVASGLYLTRLEAGNFSQTTKMLYLR
jgi:M6 family metalloprotease-like protein